MKICFISPYFGKHFGGGEKYLLDCAVLASDQHQVSMVVNQIQDVQSVKVKYQKFINKNLDAIEFIQSPIFGEASFLKKLVWTRRFDVLYYETDGSLFFSLAKKNILHIQVPLKLNKSNPIERLKLRNWAIKNTNSEFTKQVVEKSWKIKVDYVHWPMINLNLSGKKIAKQKIILHVGRFFKQLHSKKQEVIVETFAQLLKKYPNQVKGWKLVLIGSVEDNSYANQIKKMTKGLPIEIHHQVTREELIEWYQKSSLYWHATGYGVDQEKYPQNMEHFGISTVEAMACGSVPIVINKGGQPEVLGKNLTNLLWNTQQEWMAKTIELMNDAKKRQNLAKLVVERANYFSKERFETTLFAMIGK